MAYILAVNPGIFSALEPLGMPTGAVFTATVLASVIGTLAMALYAKKPFGLAPGMGINAFFVFTVCLGMGHTWQFALTAVFIEGILFIIHSLFKVRELIANAIPAGLKAAIGGGIGLFIAFIGLQNCGIIVSNESTQVALATFNKPSILLALIGLVICGLLMADAMATAAGACLGTSTTTTYVESAAGVAVGGRTGLTSFVVAICFALALFLGPLFLAIPAAATGPALVIVGYDADQHHQRGLGRLYRGDSRLHYHAADATELQHQRRHHAGPDHVCADEGRRGQEGHPPDQPHRVDPFRGLRTSIYPK